MIKLKGASRSFLVTFPHIQNAQLQDVPDLHCHRRQDLSREGGNQELGRKVGPHHVRLAITICPRQ